MDSLLPVLGTSLVLILLQIIVAVPWVATVLGLGVVRSMVRTGAILGGILAAVVGAGVLLTLLFTFFSDPDSLHTYGRLYGAVLHLQLSIDVVVLPLVLMLLIWPKGGAVALAAFREGLRQPMFWVLLAAAVLAIAASPFIPYFTFGEDFVMVKQLGYDLIMLAALVFGVLAASISISEEIEGRTAVTLMSKPVSRRQFLVGKFFGILLAALGMTVVLAWIFNWVLLFKRNDPIDQLPPVPLPASWTSFVTAVAPTGEVGDFVRGAMQWLVEVGDVLPGVVLGFCQVMVLLAIATALATRLPLVVNLVTCLLVYFMGHLTPVLVQIARRRQANDPNSAVAQLLTFMAQVFDTVVPSLDLFKIDSALLSDVPPPIDQFFFHVGQATALAVLYSVIALLLGLILFEDRDLA